MNSKEIIVYRTKDQKEPFTDWIFSLKDKTTRNRILVRLKRLESGNYGDYRRLDKGVLELRFNFGSGYRVYFGEEGNTIVLLLMGGDKNTQSKDIEKAKTYWREYNE